MVTFLAESRSEKRHKAMARARPGKVVLRAVFSHPDFPVLRNEAPTVGSGIEPDLLTFAGGAACRAKRSRARADLTIRTYRRWGISPRPEDVHECRRTGQAHSSSVGRGRRSEARKAGVREKFH
jgi:hypothetical protein